jgi:hypothetical protein
VIWTDGPKKGLRHLLARQRWHQVVHHVDRLSVVHPIVAAITPAQDIYGKLCSLVIDYGRLACAATQPLPLGCIGMCIRMQG